MGKRSSNVSTVLSRLVKIAMVAVVLPLAIGLLLGILEQLELISASGTSARQLVEWGFLTYVGLHVLLYRPVPLFRVSHRLFSSLAVWLFGGQVSTVQGQGAGGKGQGKASKGQATDPAAQGSTLVAFSPYVIPSYMVLACALGWMLSRWVDRLWLDRPIVMLIGMTMAFHWLMTADDLQQQRARWHVETYLLAIGLVFILTLLIGGACLPWALPEFSFVRALGEGLLRTQGMYHAMTQHLFF